LMMIVVGLIIATRAFRFMIGLIIATQAFRIVFGLIIAKSKNTSGQ
jgi:hypothetical protein